MNQLKSLCPSDFPLSASLFYTKANGQPRATWDYLARDGVGEVAQLQKKQLEYGSKAMTFIIYNMVDPNENPVNPFKGSPTAAQVMAGQNQPDFAELARWEPLLNIGKDPHVYFIPCLFCGDDAATTNNTAFHEFFLPGAIAWLNPYSKAYLISTEASKSMNTQQMFNMVAFIKRFTDKPVGVHLQWNRKSPLAANLDFLAYETKYNPWDGANYSVEETIAEVQDAITKCPIPLYWMEGDIYAESQLARQKARRAKEIGCWGLPGPT